MGQLDTIAAERARCPTAYGSQMRQPIPCDSASAGPSGANTLV
jgi:hypothetical protein